MRIFVLLARVPYPLEKGDKLRAYNHIKYLSKKHEIILCALNDTRLHEEALKSLRPFCSSISAIKLSKICIFINVIKALFMGKPLQVGYFYSKKAQKKVDKLIADTKPSHIFCQIIRTAEYIKKWNIPKTLDYQDAFSKGIERRIDVSPFYMKPILRIEHRRLLRYEKNIFAYFDNKTIISLPDRELIPHPEKEKITIIQNGVDFDYYKPLLRQKEYELVFTGNMQYPPNVFSAEYLAKEILPEVHKTHSKVKLLVSGASPSRKVLALATDKVHISGWVKDMRESYAKAHIFIAPMQIGIGLQNKLLEAMAMQMPCITSHLANDALGAKMNKEILVGHYAEEYARHVCFLLDNPEKATEIAMKGYQFVFSYYNWEHLTAQLEELISNT